MDETILQLKQVTKYFGSNIGVKDLSFCVRKGKITGLIGRNGSGKTTSMRIITGLIRRFKGNIAWNIDDYTGFNNRNIGYAPEKLVMSGLQTTHEFLTSLAMSRNNCGDYKKYISKMLEMFELEKHRTKYISSLSKGNLQKLSFIQAYMHDPRLVILDEPTSGIDPIVKKTMFDYIRERNQNGITTMISSHRLDELERICDDVILIEAGKVVKTAPMETILRERSSLEDYFIENLK